MKKFSLVILFSICTLIVFSQHAVGNLPKLKDGHPDDNLPEYIRKVCGFGERPDWSHDGKKILFVEKPMGEVYELELATGKIIPKTRHFLHYGFTRALYMVNGDILLSGPIQQFDLKNAKSRDIARDKCWLSVMDKSCTKPPIPLNTLCAEGPALARNSLKIAYTHRDRQKPELGKNSAILLLADIVYHDGFPKLENEKVVFDSHQLPFSLGNSSLEVQNLVPPKNELLTFTAYTINDGNNTDTYLLNLKTGEYKPLTNSPNSYDEAEGIFPDGQFTCVEHGSSVESAWPLIDLYKLKLDGSGQMQRLTNFTDYKGYKASQGVVSDDGKFLCFQIGKSGDEAGVGYGFYILDLEKAEKRILIESGQSSLYKNLASKELRRYIYLRTGLMPELTDFAANSVGEPNIVIGVKNQPHLNPYLNEVNFSEKINALEPQQYFIKSVNTANGKVLLIVGGDDMGMLYGTYAFIEHLGVRFYLEGDVIPDQKIEWEMPDIEELGKPLFQLRGLNPWGSHPSGFDQWNADDYKSVISQMLKMKMNFIGMHCYLSNPYTEPTVWVGEEKDINPDGTVKTAYPARYYNTLWRGIWGPILPKKTSEYAFGASMLFESESWGPASMNGFCPTPYKPENQIELFNRVGKQFSDVFGFARLMGVKTCLGTEAPILKFAPEETKKRLSDNGINPKENKATLELYRGIFERIKRTHPLDYYWIWTPEEWTWNSNSIHDMQQTVDDINTANQALIDVDAPFKLATSGWVLGPVSDRAAFDAAIPKNIPMSALNRNMGHVAIDTAFANITGRDKWAIPWLESDNFQGLTSLQLNAGRTIYDASIAKKFDCNGLLGLFWRTRELGPNVSALARAGWNLPVFPENNPINIHQDNLVGPISTRTAPVQDFYKDFAAANFGSEVNEKVAEIFSSIDGKVPISVALSCPSGSLLPQITEMKNSKTASGGVVSGEDTISWENIAKSYSFVSEMENLRPGIKGTGNLERFDFWLNTFRYHKQLAKIRFTLGSFEIAIQNSKKQSGFELQRTSAIAEAFPIYIQLVKEYEQLASYCMSYITTNSGIATIVNLMQHKDFWQMAIENPAKNLIELIGEPLPEIAIPGKEYKGESRMFMTSLRTNLIEGEPLHIKVNLLSKSNPKAITLFWRMLGAAEYSKMQLKNSAGSIYTATLDAEKIGANDFEYFIEAEFETEKNIVLPATAREINNTVIVIQKTN